MAPPRSRASRPSDASAAAPRGPVRPRLAKLAKTQAPALANASLLFNSVGFTQLSKVLTTPAIATIERARGHGAPLDGPRLVCLARGPRGGFENADAVVPGILTGRLAAAAVT